MYISLCGCVLSTQSVDPMVIVLCENTIIIEATSISCTDNYFVCWCVFNNLTSVLSRLDGCGTTTLIAVSTALPVLVWVVYPQEAPTTRWGEALNLGSNYCSSPTALFQLLFFFQVE